MYNKLKKKKRFYTAHRGKQKLSAQPPEPGISASLKQSFQYL